MAAPMLVVIFLRGGADGLGLVCHSSDPDFIAARPEDCASRTKATAQATGSRRRSPISIFGFIRAQAGCRSFMTRVVYRKSMRPA